ncbi:gluconolactone oxidase [Diaporthe amygdali]|uniref:gluconolactone oxidase n=1 Tax=Phomopsis amygdali TaxID=1214568 RepID=UPI0022FED83A|nr:gluconolactone oxidase [Diaporthe amygdali]KAJ0120825.1 gluconolactone oxidase [Diaporthe amygdali]
MHFPTIITLLSVLACTAVAQRGKGGECRSDADCIRCVNGVTPLICKTDATSTTGKRCGAVGEYWETLRSIA